MPACSCKRITARAGRDVPLSTAGLAGTLLGRLKGVRKAGEGWQAFCPAHDDRNDRSLSLRQAHDRVLVHCFTGCEPQQIVEAVDLRMSDLFREQIKLPARSCTLEAYAKAKHLPVEHLKGLGLSTTKYSDSTAVRMPYLDESGNLAAERFRLSLDKGVGEDNRFRWARGAKLCLYGLWRLDAGGEDYTTLVEGESDCQTLWLHDEPALGLPGANNWREDRDAVPLSRFRTVYVILEPDTGGRTIERWLMTSAIRDRVRLIDLGVYKDPSGLYLDDPERFRERWAKALQTATPWSEYAAALDYRRRLGQPQVERGRVLAERALSGNHVIRFVAEDVRRERTGVHGLVRILYDSSPLVYNAFNIDRDEDRTRLANSAAKMLGSAIDELGGSYTKTELKRDLDLFCSGVWDAVIGTLAPERVHGDAGNNPLEFVAAPHVIRGGGTVLFGQHGGGKSWTALFIAVAVDSGTNNLWGTTPANTLYVNLERSAGSLARRLEGINLALGLEPDRPLDIQNARGKSLMDVRDAIRRAVDGGIEFLVLDSITRTGMGDLNENRPVNAIADTLNDIAPTWLGLAHAPRGDTTHVFGSVMLEAAADVMVRFTSAFGGEDGKELGVSLEVTKANDLPPTAPMYLAYGFDTFGVKTIRKAKLSEFPELVSQREVKPADEVHDWLLHEAGTATADEVARALGKDRSTWGKILRADPRFRSQKVGKKVQYSVKAKAGLL